MATGIFPIDNHLIAIGEHALIAIGRDIPQRQFIALLDLVAEQLRIFGRGAAHMRQRGLPATADFMFALVSTEELQQLNQLLVKQLKNRYNDPNLHKRFTIGVDRAKMKLYDLEQKAQDAVLKEAESKPVFDRGRSTDKFKNLKV